MFKIKSMTSLLMIMMALAACSSDPKVIELNNNADPQTELNRVDSNIQQAQKNQVDVLSPKNFEAARQAWNTAVEARAANKDQKAVLHHIAIAQAYLDKANTVADMEAQILKGPVEARQDAMTAKASTYYPKEIIYVDNSFKKLTEQVERNDTSGLDSSRAALEASYRDIELKSIKMEKLETARLNIEEAVKEGAKKLTPKTLEWANKHYTEDVATIETHRHNSNLVDEASLDANTSAARLLKMVRNAKSLSVKSPEDFAKQIESNDIAAVESENELSRSAHALARSQGKLANASALNNKLESQVWLDKEYESARSQFTKDEAEVYKQGDNLLLRLKGLSFANNKAVISSRNFPLLAKVQKVIGDVGPSRIAIEGHTDSIGDKKLNEELSTKRAESVQSYLIANNNVSAEKVTATGFADSKPIATNKTAEGRAQNRRVDVIITSESVK